MDSNEVRQLAIVKVKNALRNFEDAEKSLDRNDVRNVAALREIDAAIEKVHGAILKLETTPVHSGGSRRRTRKRRNHRRC